MAQFRDANRQLEIKLYESGQLQHDPHSKVMLDPVSVALANAPIDDEPASEEEARDIAEARAAYVRGELVSNEEVLSEFGLSSQDFERMGRTPLEPEPHHPGR